MSITTRIISILVAGCLIVSAIAAQKGRDKIEIVKPKNYSAPVLEPSADLQVILDKAVSDVMAAGNFKPGEMAATVIDVRDSSKWATASFEGERQLYTASV